MVENSGEAAVELSTVALSSFLASLSLSFAVSSNLGLKDVSTWIACHCHIMCSFIELLHSLSM